MRSEAELTEAMDRYGDTVRRICFLHLGNTADVEDVFQDVFLKYILYEPRFEDESHKKAWLIRVAVNRCRDLQRSVFRRRVSSLEELGEAAPAAEAEHREVLDAVLRLPERYRDVIYLFYYEGYSAVEIAAMLGRRENTVYTWLARARLQLRERLGGDGDERAHQSGV